MINTETFVAPLQRLWQNAVVRWWIVGIAAMVLNIVLLDWFKVSVGLSLTVASLLSSELITIVRYGVLDLWVFRSGGLSWKRCWEYHVANFSGFFLWTFIIVALGNKLQWDHKLAAIAATMVTVCWSMATNFLWIWRKPKKEHQGSGLG
jgi:putative flippase GtrA